MHDLKSEDGTIGVAFVTDSFGMGANAKKIKKVFNITTPNSLDSKSQQEHEHSLNQPKQMIPAYHL